MLSWNRRRSVVIAAAASLSLVLAGACASGGKKPKEFVPATNLNIRLEQEDARNVLNERIAYIRNESGQPIVVTQVNVMDCRNVRQYCGITKKDVKIAPYQRKEILRLQPDNRAQAWNYRFLYSWRAEGGARARAEIRAENGDSNAVQELKAFAHQDEVKKADTLYHDTEVNMTALRELKEKFKSLRAEPDSLVLKVGSFVFMQNIRPVAVHENGKALGRMRGGYTLRVPAGTSLNVVRDSLKAVAPGRQMVQFVSAPLFGADGKTAVQGALLTVIVRP